MHPAIERLALLLGRLEACDLLAIHVRDEELEHILPLVDHQRVFRPGGLEQLRMSQMVSPRSNMWPQARR